MRTFASIKVAGWVPALALLSTATACGSSAGGSGSASAGGHGGAAASGAVTSSAAASGAGGAMSSTVTTGAGGSTDAGAVVVLPLGAVKNEMAEASCSDPNLPPGAKCTTLTVSCPGIPDIDAEIAVTEPPTSIVGTVVLHDGSTGMTFLDSLFADAYVVANLRAVQVRWMSPWENSSSGLKAAACRPATVFQWAYDKPHGGSKVAGFCLQGDSGGAGAISYALAHYGLKSVVDHALLSAGPPFGRIDYGCDPSLYNGPPRSPCPELPDAPIAYGVGAQGLLNAAEATTSCGMAAPAQADIDRWAQDSVVSPGADYDYGKTAIDFWFCANKPNETTGLGSFFTEQIMSPHKVTCVKNSIQGMPCSGEQVFSDQGAHQQMSAAMVAGCVVK